MGDDTTTNNHAEQENPTPNSDNKANPDKVTSGEEEKLVPSFRLKEETDKRKSLETEFETYKQEQEKKRQESEKQREYDIAEARFWKDILSDEKVQAVKQQHSTLSWEEAIRLAWKEPKIQSYAWWFSWRMPHGVIDTNSKKVTWSWLAEQPQNVRMEYRAKAKNGEVEIDYNQ